MVTYPGKSMMHHLAHIFIRAVLLCSLAHCFFVSRAHAEGEVKIKILAMNPSPSQKIESLVRQNLPPEIKPEDVVDNAGMEIKFNTDEGVYYVSKQVNLEPKEAVTIEVLVRNVWLVPEERLTRLRDTVSTTTKSLAKTKYEKTAQLLQDKVSERIGTIEEEQGRNIGIGKRIELYRSHLKQLDGIEKEVLSISALRELEGEQAEGVRTAKLVISAENPSDEPRKMTVRSDLPKEITANDVLDRLDFLLLYDETKQRFSVEKEDQFEARETKKYEITLRDVWYIPRIELERYKEQTDKLVALLKGSAYENYVTQQAKIIDDTLVSIDQLQIEVQSAESIQDRIEAFALNSERLGLINKKVKELQDLLLEVPIKRQVSEIEKIKQAIKSLTKVMDIIRMGFKPDLSTTWWIILGIIAFLIVLSTTFYVTWLSRLKDAKGGAKGVKKDKKGTAAKTPAGQAQSTAAATQPAAEGKPA